MSGTIEDNSVDVTSAELDRWSASAWQAEPLTAKLVYEVEKLVNDPCRERLHRVAIAAWYASTLADEPLRTHLVAMAKELQAKAQCDNSSSDLPALK
jgi:hypothetical protein